MLLERKRKSLICLTQTITASAVLISPMAPVGGLIEPDTPIICGGKLESGDKSSECYTLTNRQFVQSETSLKKYNYWNEGSPVVNAALVVIGGGDWGDGKFKKVSTPLT